MASTVLTVLLAGGVALAATVNCDPDAYKRVGTSGPDTLYGTGDDYDNIRGREGADKIYGLGGDDRTIHSEGLYGDDVVRGGHGSDRVFGGPGSDSITGGPGDDFIRAEDTTRDRIYCGLGHDTVFADNMQGNSPSDRRDFVDDSCEDVTRR